MQVFIAGKNRKVLRREDNTAYYIDKKSGNKIDVTHMFKKGAKLVLKKKYIGGVDYWVKYEWDISHADMDATKLKRMIQELNVWFQNPESKDKFNVFLEQLKSISTKSEFRYDYTVDANTIIEHPNDIILYELGNIFSKDVAPGNFVSFMKVLMQIFTVQTYFETFKNSVDLTQLPDIPLLLPIAKNKIHRFYIALTTLYETFGECRPEQSKTKCKVVKLQINLEDIIEHHECFKFIYGQYNLNFKEYYSKYLNFNAKPTNAKKRSQRSPTSQRSPRLKKTTTAMLKHLKSL
jgi:hypothetical protein